MGKTWVHPRKTGTGEQEPQGCSLLMLFWCHRKSEGEMHSTSCYLVSVKLSSHIFCAGWLVAQPGLPQRTDGRAGKPQRECPSKGTRSPGWWRIWRCVSLCVQVESRLFLFRPLKEILSSDERNLSSREKELAQLCMKLRLGVGGVLGRFLW